jgi:hypothetical protein
MCTDDEAEVLDPAVMPVETPQWAVAKGRRLDNLSDVRREMVSCYWLWRRSGRLSVGHMAAAVQALQVIAKTLEAERDSRLEELEAKVRHLEELQAGSGLTPWRLAI